MNVGGFSPNIYLLSPDILNNRNIGEKGEK